MKYDIHYPGSMINFCVFFRKQPAKSQSSISLLKEYKVQIWRIKKQYVSIHRHPVNTNRIQTICFLNPSSSFEYQVEKQRPPTPSVAEDSEVTICLSLNNWTSVNVTRLLIILCLSWNQLICQWHTFPLPSFMIDYSIYYDHLRNQLGNKMHSSDLSPKPHPNDQHQTNASKWSSLSKWGVLPGRSWCRASGTSAPEKSSRQSRSGSPIATSLIGPPLDTWMVQSLVQKYAKPKAIWVLQGPDLESRYTIPIPF